MIDSPIRTLAAPGWVLVVLAACVSAASNEETIYAKVGGEVTLKPKPVVTDATKNIIWRAGGNMAVDMDEEHIKYYPLFERQSDLNNRTGELTIKSLTYEHAQSYTTEIDSIKNDHIIHLKVLSPVPVPTIHKSCAEDASTCTLTCEGNTTRREPVSYAWVSDSTKVQHNTKVYQITKDSSSGVSEFRCKMINPVSDESSTPLPNPFKSSSSTSGSRISAGVTVFVILLVAVILVVIFHRLKTGECFFNKTSMPWEGDFWRNTKGQQAETPEQNGTSTTPLKDEETATSAV